MDACQRYTAGMEDFRNNRMPGLMTRNAGHEALSVFWVVFSVGYDVISSDAVDYTNAAHNNVLHGDTLATLISRQQSGDIHRRFKFSAGTPV